MARFVCLVAAVLFAFASAPASAHAIVTGSSLKDRPVKAGAPTKVLLDFNSGIEVALSRVFLVSQGDVHAPVPIAAGRKPGQLVIDLPPLKPGEYALNCRVFAADGHLTEEILRVRVAE